MWTYYVHMKTATIREVRNEFSKLETWLAEGETIEIRRRGVPVAHLTRPVTETKKPVVWPDIRARQRRISGDRVLSQEDLDAIKAYELEGQEG